MAKYKQMIYKVFLITITFLLSSLMIMMILSVFISKEMDVIIVYWGPVTNPSGKMIYQPTWYFYTLCLLLSGAMTIATIRSTKDVK